MEIKRFFTIIVFVLLAHIAVVGQSLTHPHIWVSNSDKQQILDNIANHSWASSLFSQLKTRVDSKKNTHKTNPTAILNTVPAIPGILSDRSAHTDMLTVASEAAILYYLTDDADYAQFATDILSHYTERLSLADSVKYNNGSTGLFFSDWWLESRALFPKIAMIYDMVYNFANNPTNTVFDKTSNSRKAFDNAAAQKTVKTLAAVVFKSISAPKSNHSVLAGNGALFNTLMIDDDATREQFFNRYYSNTNERFDAFTWTLNNFTTDDIWPETLGYAMGSHEFVIEALDVIDRYKPDLNIVTNNTRIFDGYALYSNFFYPSNEVLRFGDTGYEADMLEGFQWILNTAKRKNMTPYITLAKEALQYEYQKMGGFNPTISTDRLGWFNPLQLLWGVDVESTVSPKAPNIESNLRISHAGIVIQRNYNTPNIEQDGMMLYTGGATYVHTHSTGIDMELYGKGYILGAESGSGSYGSDEHENYRVRLAAHNTVIVNGSGKRGSNWESKMSNVELDACEPKSQETPIAENFSFTTQKINDTYNNCLQQRTNSIIRTSPTSAYYFDMIRSKTKSGENITHDYLYHNIGDAVTLKYTDNATVPLSASTKYASDAEGSVTGWKFFESVMSSASTDKAIKASFALTTVNKYMNVYLPSGVNREYATALAPNTKGAKSGYDRKKTPMLTIRQNSEAWNKPFVAVFEPANNSQNTVQSVETIVKDEKVVGAIVISNVNGTEIKDIVIALDNTATVDLPEHFISFTGRFGIVRTQKVTDETENVSLYIGEGTILKYRGEEVLATTEKKAIKIIENLTLIDNTTQFNLAVSVPLGGGTITVSPAKANYSAGETVLLTAVPDEGYVMDKWLGNAMGSAYTYSLTLFADKNITANFRYADNFTLDITSEYGTVSNSVSGTRIKEHAYVDLTAVAEYGYAFTGWTGDLETTDNPITFRVDSNMNLTANYIALQMYSINVDIEGNGTVTKNPDREQYVVGSSVSLTPVPGTGDSFTKWSGDYSSFFPAINITVDKDYSILARFSGEAVISGIEEAQLYTTKVSPNPSSGSMILTTDYAGACNYTIFDITGKIVQDGILQDAKPLTIERSGIYFIQLQTLTQIKTMKVIVTE